MDSSSMLAIKKYRVWTVKNGDFKLILCLDDGTNELLSKRSMIN